MQPGPPVQQLGPTPPGGLPAANPGATAVNAAIIAAAQAAADNLAGKVCSSFHRSSEGPVPESAVRIYQYDMRIDSRSSVSPFCYVAVRWGLSNVDMAAQFGAAMGGAVPTAGAVAAGVASAQQIAARLMQQAAPGGAPASSAAAGSGLDVAQPHYEADLEINDFPQHARWKARPRTLFA